MGGVIAERLSVRVIIMQARRALVVLCIGMQCATYEPPSYCKTKVHQFCLQWCQGCAYDSIVSYSDISCCRRSVGCNNNRYSVIIIIL